jgi:hypothetical protein
MSRDNLSFTIIFCCRFRSGQYLIVLARVSCEMAGKEEKLGPGSIIRHPSILLNSAWALKDLYMKYTTFNCHFLQ